jgi:hypothetical protein
LPRASGLSAPTAADIAMGAVANFSITVGLLLFINNFIKALIFQCLTVVSSSPCS